MHPREGRAVEVGLAGQVVVARGRVDRHARHQFLVDHEHTLVQFVPVAVRVGVVAGRDEQLCVQPDRQHRVAYLDLLLGSCAHVFHHEEADHG